MDKPPSLKPLYWVGSSKRDLLSLPEPVVDFFGYALYLAQDGKKHGQAKPLKGFGSAGVLEVVEDGIRVRIEPSIPYGLRAWCSCCICSKRSPSAE
jgi:phage-related protein